MKLHPSNLNIIGLPQYVDNNLIESIKKDGQRVPIIVKKKGEKWECVDGVRRAIACLILGIEVECEEIL